MKRILFIIAILTFVSLTIYGQSIPKQISYQGVLKNAAGVNVTDGSYSLLFKVYNEPTGGTPLWTETQSVTVKNGFFSAQLGSVTPIASVPFDRLHFLGISVGTGTELTPRTMLTPSPYSFMALNVMDSAVVKSFNGLKSNINLVAGTNITLTPSGNNITINASTGGGGTIGGSGTANYLPLFTNSNTLGNSKLFLDSNGDIQVGSDGVRTQLTLSANNDVAEGGQINWNGAGNYDDWYQDLAFNNMRIRSNSVNNNFVEIFNNGTGNSGLYVEGNVGIGTATPAATLDVAGTVRVGTTGKIFSEIREITGTTATTGDRTFFSYPSGYTNSNTRVLSCEINYDGTSWVGLGGTSTPTTGEQRIFYFLGSSISLYYQSIPSFQNRAFRMLVMKVQ